jgi:hypothetical protein
MRTLSDKWNPRLWLRDWLNKPSQAELKERRAAEAAAAQMLLNLERVTRRSNDERVAKAISCPTSAS